MIPNFQPLLHVTEALGQLREAKQTLANPAFKATLESVELTLQKWIQDYSVALQTLKIEDFSTKNPGTAGSKVQKLPSGEN